MRNSKQAMWNYSYLFALLAIIMVTLPSCVDTVKRASLNNASSENDAYIYGRFQLEVKRSIAFLFNCSSEIVLEMKHIATGKTYKIGLKSSRPVYAVKVIPGRYKFVSIDFFYGIGRLSKSNPVNSQATYHISKGTAAYFGDYHGYVACRGKRPSLGEAGAPFAWQMKTVKFDRASFIRTSNELRRLHPGFSKSVRMRPIKITK